MDAATEFRVFVPPPAAARGISEPHTDDLKVSGISQYKWHTVLILPFDGSVPWIADRVFQGARQMLASIAEYISAEMEPDIGRLLLRYGFSFDIALQEDGSVQLVEINPFGAMSGYGACLFSWVVDGRMLSGLEESEVAIVLESGFPIV
ncbi:hypothetical protein IQ06DRAFT_309533 [Phaeosphaeriaceae sp. SRC1lsM3a]|nr:hypothetical protein IQ06DRAFT_309533 [Stagonospora sp. SRC1lsM3a]